MFTQNKIILMQPNTAFDYSIQLDSYVLDTLDLLVSVSERLENTFSATAKGIYKTNIIS